MKFANDRTVPPGGQYFYQVPETQVVITSLTRVDFFDMIRKHYGENGLVCPKDIEDVALDFMCRRLPKGFCQGEGKLVGTIITMSQVRQKTMDAAAITGRVTPGEAKRRALICGACPMNDRSSCPTCSGVNAWAGRLGGVRVPGGDTYLGICRADGLAMSAGVALESAPVTGEVPDQCWRKAKNDN